MLLKKFYQLDSKERVLAVSDSDYQEILNNVIDYEIKYWLNELNDIKGIEVNRFIFSSCYKDDIDLEVVDIEEFLSNEYYPISNEYTYDLIEQGKELYSKGEEEEAFNILNEALWLMGDEIDGYVEYIYSIDKKEFICEYNDWIENELSDTYIDVEDNYKIYTEHDLEELDEDDIIIYENF